MAKKKRGKLRGAAKAKFLRRMKLGRLKAAGKSTRKRKYRRNPLDARLRTAMAGVNAPKPKRKRKTRKTKAARRVSKISRKRSLAAKKAAKTRAAKKAVRSRAGKKAALTRKRRSRRTVAKKSVRRSKRKGGKSMAKRRRRARRAAPKVKRLKARTKQRGRGVRGLKKARKSIKYTRKHGSGLARQYARKFRMRTNPVGMIVDVLKQALPVGAGFYLSRIAAGNVGQVPGLGKLLKQIGKAAGPVVSLGVVVGLNFLTKKVNVLGKYRTGLMVGAGLAALDSIVKATPVAGMLGVGGVYDEALSEYVPEADYITTDAFEEEAAYEEAAEYMDDGGHSLAASPGRGVHALRARALGPAVGADSRYYTGIFAAGFGG